MMLSDPPDRNSASVPVRTPSSQILLASSRFLRSSSPSDQAAEDEDPRTAFLQELPSPPLRLFPHDAGLFSPTTCPLPPSSSYAYPPPSSPPSSPLPLSSHNTSSSNTTGSKGISRLPFSSLSVFRKTATFVFRIKEVRRYTSHGRAKPPSESSDGASDHIMAGRHSVSTVGEGKLVQDASENRRPRQRRSVSEQSSILPPKGDLLRYEIRVVQPGDHEHTRVAMMLIDSGNISENLISRKLVDCFGLACETGKLPLKSRICTRVPFLSKSVRDPRTEKIRNLDGTIMRGQGDMVTIRWSGVNDATISDPIVVFRETFYETRHRIVDSCMDDVVLQFQEVYRLRLREQRTGAAGHIVKPPTADRSKRKHPPRVCSCLKRTNLSQVNSPGPTITNVGMNTRNFESKTAGIALRGHRTYPRIPAASIRQRALRPSFQLRGESNASCT